ncbi:hypothetical protein FO519_005270 [Halicephalobus sp. NKZ332]|nr:hypothetical protein FO519_005270 [Halicephalobus sp. NKZ332]
MSFRIFLIFYFCFETISSLAIRPKKIDGPLTPHFVNWLNQNGYGKYPYERFDLGPTGSFGGKNNDGNHIVNQPVVFIHGNSDGALAIPGNYSSGWTSSIEYFLSQGYTSAELYVTTWGDRNPENAKYRSHTCEYLIYIRRFVEAVLEYTQASKIDVISHSMGVTLARRVIKGGMHFDENGSGANLGMCTCSGIEDDYAFPTCNSNNGFWPGDPCNSSKACANISEIQCSKDFNYSHYLTNLNSEGTKEGNFVFSSWSKGKHYFICGLLYFFSADDILMNECHVYGRPTALITDSKCFKIYDGLTHMETKELTVKDQHRMVVHHLCV